MIDKPRVFKRFCGTCNQPTDLSAAFADLNAELSRIRCGMGDDFGDDPVKVIQTLKAEIERLKHRLSIWDSFGVHEERDKLRSEVNRLNIENTRYFNEKITQKMVLNVREHENKELKSKLAEVEAEAQKDYADMRSFQLKFIEADKALTREREAAKVMREALVDIAEKKTYAFKRGISWFRVAQVVAREALAKADEIRGGE